jgi:tetratricopeptide (TPR) repeat protein
MPISNKQSLNCNSRLVVSTGRPLESGGRVGSVTIRETIILVGLLAAAGCGAQRNTANFAYAELAYQTALEHYQAKDYDKACESFRAAVDDGGLIVDEYVNAQLLLAVCEARLGNVEAAHAAIDAVADGAPDLARLHAARAFVYEKEQKLAEARFERRLARRENPRVAFFK